MDRTNVIGEKVKSLRTAKEISLEELADRTGLAVEQITRIEENIDIPSLAPLVKLARALGVRLGTFLDDQPDEAGPVVCRRGDADDTISFSNNALDARQHLHYHSLSRSKTDRHMEPFIVDIDANGSNEFNLSAHEGEEFILKSATKLFSVLLASKRPLITELADKLRLKYPLLPTISPCPTMRLEAIRSIIPISCRRYPKSV